MANGTPVTFGGGFAQGLQGGAAAASNVLNSVSNMQAVQQKREAAKRQIMTDAFERSLESAKLFDEIIATAVAEGRPLHPQEQAMRERIKEQIRITAQGAGQDPSIADLVDQNIAARLERQPQFEGASPLGKLLQDRNALPEGSPERTQLDQVIADEIKKDPRTQVVKKRAANGDEVTLLVNLDTGATVAELGRGPTVQFQPTELPGGAQQKLQERADVLGQGIEQVKNLLALPEGTFGVGASVKRGVRGAARVAGELASLGLPDQVMAPIQGLAQLGESLIDRNIAEGRLDADAAAEFARSDLTEAETVEIQLAFLVANALQPDGKLLKDSINSAREIVKLSGWTSEKTARERLATVLNILERSQRGLKGSADLSKKPGTEGESKATGGKRLIYDPSTDSLSPAQ